MSLTTQIAHELVALTITRGSHLVSLVLGDERWSFPVVDGRVGPLTGSDDAHHREDRMAQELAMIASVDGVVLRRERLPGARAQERWISAAGVARCMRGERVADDDGAPVDKPGALVLIDALDALSEAMTQAGTYAEMLDLTVRALIDVHPSGLMLHSDGDGGWLSPRGRLLGRTDRLSAAAFEQRVEVAPPIGEAYEPLIGSPPLCVLVPLGADMVVALPWSDDGVQGRPMAAILMHRLFRIATTTVVGRPQRDS